MTHRRSTLNVVATLVFATTIMVSGCATTNYDTELFQADMLSGRTTWAFTENPVRQPTQNLALDTSAGRMFQDEVRERINAKGYAEVEAGKADLEVFYQTVANPILDTRRTNYWEPLSMHVAMESPSTAREAGLAISVADPKTQKIIWQGIATGVIKKGRVTDQRIREILDNLLGELPEAK